jgi:hypothetical protein
MTSMTSEMHDHQIFVTIIKFIFIYMVNLSLVCTTTKLINVFATIGANPWPIAVIFNPYLLMIAIS